MKTLAIIAEYNPFHNGHLYHLNKAKELTGSTHSVAIMSGSFLQRGLPAMWDKYTRSKMATTAGIDLVLELPFVYATGSAKDFSTGAVSILDKLQSIDYLCFGAETDDIELLSSIAEIINEEPKSYKDQLTLALASGVSFPYARTIALNKYFEADDNNVSDIINQPNNILAIEYLAALKRINSNIEPILIKRNHAMYHDTTMYGSISSASAIRAGIQSEDFNLSHITSEIPMCIHEIIAQSYLSSWPITEDELTPFLQSKLINPLNYNEVCDISEDLANKLNKLYPVTNYQDAIKALSSKDLTTTRINRSIIHLLLEYKELHRKEFIDNSYGLYANILSFRKDSSQLIKAINQQTLIPLITKKADFEKYLSGYINLDYNVAKTMWNYDTKATNLYNCMVYNRYGTILPNDYNIQLPII